MITRARWPLLRHRSTTKSLTIEKDFLSEFSRGKLTEISYRGESTGKRAFSLHDERVAVDPNIFTTIELSWRAPSLLDEYDTPSSIFPFSATQKNFWSPQNTFLPRQVRKAALGTHLWLIVE